ncbi:MAG: hypothetical protein IKL96_05385, partial [Kiritimatiellae bacterium]|nr:hypothetical protein [Kiritimatiellia bacterium]
AWQCRMRYREVVTFDHHGKERRVTVEFGVVPVRLPDIPGRLLHMVVARSVARMSFRIHEVPEFHFYAIADGASDILKRGRRWRGFDPGEAEKSDEASLFAFFGLNTG